MEQDALLPPEVQEELEQRILRFWKTRPNPETRRSMNSDMVDFLGGPLDALALWQFLQMSDAEIREKVEAFQERMLRRRLKLATIKRRMATLRLWLQFLHREGIRSQVSDRLVRLEPAFIEAVEAAAAGQRSPSTSPDEAAGKSEPLEQHVVQQLLKAPDLTTVRGLRDWNILHLMVHDGLSRRQISTLNVGDFDQGQDLLRVPRLRRAKSMNLRLERSHEAAGTAQEQEQDPKAETEADPDAIFLLVHLQPEATQRLGEYLAASDYQGQENAPLFYSLDNKRAKSQSSARRLTQDGLYDIVSFYAQSIGHPKINSRKLQKTAAARVASQLTSPPPTSSQPGE